MQLAEKDLIRCTRNVPKCVRTLLQTYDGKLFIGGGFIRAIVAGEKPSDIDLFGPSVEFLEACAAFLKNGENAKVHKTENAITCVIPGMPPIQFITRWLYDDPERLIAEFDFTICQTVMWIKRHVSDEAGAVEKLRWESLIGEGFYPDLAARRLTYTAPNRVEDAGGSLMRVRKFLGRGYNIQADSLGAVVSRLFSGLRKDNEDIWDEAKRAQIITGLLREVDPLLVLNNEFVEEQDAENGL